MPASRAARSTATPSSRAIRSNVRHEPRASALTSIPLLPSGTSGTAGVLMRPLSGPAGARRQKHNRPTYAGTAAPWTSYRPNTTNHPVSP